MAWEYGCLLVVRIGAVAFVNYVLQLEEDDESCRKETGVETLLNSRFVAIQENKDIYIRSSQLSFVLPSLNC